MQFMLAGFSLMACAIVVSLAVGEICHMGDGNTPPAMSPIPNARSSRGGPDLDPWRGVHVAEETLRGLLMADVVLGAALTGKMFRASVPA